MKKISLIFLTVFIIFGSNLSFAQTGTKAVQIKSGSIFVPHFGGSLSASGPITLNSDIFTSSGTIRNHYSQSPWSSICDPYCQSGSTFQVGSMSFFDAVYPTGDFKINGVTYTNVFHQGGLTMPPPYRIAFQVPRIVRKKGKMFFSSEFEVSGRLRVCRINEFAAICPPESLLFDNEIYGHGILRVTMKIKYDYQFSKNCAPQCHPRAYLQPESYEYIFQE